jgi:hypothetical protein
MPTDPLSHEELWLSLDRCGFLGSRFRGISRVEDLSPGLGRSRIFRIGLERETGGSGAGSTLILKIPNWGGDSLVDPRDPLVLRRELLVSESGLAGRLPGGLAMPALLGTDCRGEQIWMWMSDLAPWFAAPWTPRRAHRAAAGCALFHELWCREPDLRELPWLGREEYAAYAHHVEAGHRNLDALGQDPRWADLLPAEAVPRLHRSLDLTPWAIEEMRQLPASFAHGDFHLRNLGVYADGTLLVVDWACFGLAPLGCDLGAFVSVYRLFGGVATDGPKLERSLLDVYVAEVERLARQDGLREPISRAYHLWHLTWGLHLRLGPGLTALLQDFIPDEKERQRTAADIREGCLRALAGLDELRGGQG